MSKLKAIYILEPEGDGAWVISKLKGAELETKYTYDSFGCDCKGYKFRSSCTHQELVTNTFKADSEPDAEVIARWKGILEVAFPGSLSNYSAGKHEVLIKASVRAILWAQMEGIVFRLIFTPDFDEDKKEFKPND